MTRPTGILPSGYAGGLRGLSTGHRATAPALPQLGHPCPRLPWRQTGRHPCRPPCGLSFAHPPRHRGTAGRAARSQRALFRRARSRTGAGAKPQQATLCCGFCFSASSPSAGQDGPLLYRGPLRGGETGSTGRAAGESMDGLAFSSGHDARSKSPAPTHGLAGHDARQAPSGGSFSLGYFSFGQAKEK